MRTLKAVRETYDRLRRRYYMDAADPERVPLAASELRWAWTQDKSSLGWTHFDEDDDPHLVEVPYGAGVRVVTLVLLHELSHMRNPGADCTHRDRWWRAECRRLGALDAFGREGIF